jgi:hypothetical protein
MARKKRRNQKRKIKRNNLKLKLKFKLIKIYKTSMENKN